MFIGFEIKKCEECPFLQLERTQGAGYAHDYWCSKINRKIAGYVEYPSEIPEVPEWCPCKIEIENKEEIYEKLEHLSNVNKLHSIITFVLLEKSRSFMYDLRKNFPTASPSEIDKMLDELGWSRISSDSNGWEQDTWYNYTHESYPCGLTMGYGGFYGDLELYRSDIDD